MSNQIFVKEQAFKFLKVEEYFGRYRDWDMLGDVHGHSFDAGKRTLVLDFVKSDGNPCSMLLQFPTSGIIRFRFNPGKTGGQYSDQNSRSVVQNTFKELTDILDNRVDQFFQIQSVKDNADGIELYTSGNSQGSDLQVKKDIKVAVTYKPFAITISMVVSNEEFVLWQTAETPIYYTQNGDDDYAVIQTVKKPATAEYIGFGEQGGQSLCKNTAQLNYFNFDNMRYRQVYNRGPLDPREPLYHSDPFFMEFNGVPEYNTVNGIFIDNVGQVFLDIGYLNSGRYMFGTRFGDMDYFFFAGHDAKDVLGGFTSLVGKSRLKPRYCLGYHQGCYGYDSRDKVEWAAQKYREYQIPLDGLHIDVDIQNSYKTFTIDTGKFPNPKEMFSYLRGLGIKCSTNITPIISSKNADDYQSYTQAKAMGYFVVDKRCDPSNPESKRYQLYGGGNQYQPNQNDWVEGFNSGEPFIGEVYYGNDATGNELGTPGHYADLGRREVRDWWGTQYQYLFDMGLEIVWQDMTTPAIRDFRGDMKGFPFRLYVTDDSVSANAPKLTPAIKVWNLYSYNLHKATYHGLNHLKSRENKRNFIIGRGCFTGSHRFAGLWTGDNSSDWDFLKMNVSQVLSLGMCGLDICGQDIGGFETGMDNGKWASPELLIRWTAAGAFMPWFRNHYVRKGRKEFQEPFMYVEWFNQYQGGNLPEPKDLYRMVLPICKHFIELRYRLLQLFYDAMFENTITGIPICRPLFLNDPQDVSLYNDKQSFLDNEFFVGKDLLIAPVLSPQSENMNGGRRDVYLPIGSDWYCFMNNTMPLGSVVEGGTTVSDFDANLNINGNHINFIVPIYVRAGAVIPTIELEQYVGQLNDQGKPNPITLNIYPGKSGEYTLYMDDGVSRSSAPQTKTRAGDDPQAESEYRQTSVSHCLAGKTRTITIERKHDNYKPKEDFFYIAVLHDPLEIRRGTGCLRSVQVGGQLLTQITQGTPEQLSNELNAFADNGWYYNGNINISFIKVFDNNPSITVVVEYF
jgi:alpha-glucosidase